MGSVVFRIGYPDWIRQCLEGANRQDATNETVLTLNTKMDFDALVKFVQEHFTDGLAVVIGSGLSAAEEIPGMPELAMYLKKESGVLTGADKPLWDQIMAMLDAGEGVEAALLKQPPSDALEVWIAQNTCKLLMPEERKVMSAVLRGERTASPDNIPGKGIKAYDWIANSDPQLRPTD